MRVLVDTHCLLWWLGDSAKLNKKTRGIFLNDQNDLILSAVVSWEISVKYRLKRLKLPKSPKQIFAELFEEGQFSGLAIEHTHTLKTYELSDHHEDPFDRLLIAQAMVENLPVLTADSQLKKYPVKILWAI